ncbi:MAG: peptidylprolyl isomerase [Campylobacterota bacterium]|nr:peptidylprolyl isomerase [Campylobacterota bacterium]
MISWMQKHNKYLIVTIWIATIAFIGAGFVGWGSYQYGSKAGSIAKVGDIEIDDATFDMTYKNIYQQYNQMMQGKLDEKKAKEMGLLKQALGSLITQAQLLNLANEFGIIVSDDELAQKLTEIPAFQNKGMFDKAIYQTYLKSQHLEARTFEHVLRNEAIIQKTLSLLNSQSLPFEKEVLTSAISVADKIAYKVLTQDDLNLTIDENSLQSYWEAHKSSYMTPKKYVLDVLWTESKGTIVTEEEIKTFYGENSFNYVDDSGKQLQLDGAREKVVADLKMKKSKKSAQKQYIAYKKGKIDKSETLTLALDDTLLSTEIWKEIQQKDVNAILKPKAVVDRYATLRIVKAEEPQEMVFNEAKTLVTADYKKKASEEGLTKLAESTLKDFDKSNSIVSDFVTLDTRDNLKPLNTQESLQFLQKLFTSTKEKGIIALSNKVIVYNILEQRMTLEEDSNVTDFVNNSVNQIKRQDFESNLLKNLDQKYKTQVFVEGLSN